MDCEILGSLLLLAKISINCQEKENASFFLEEAFKSMINYDGSIDPSYHRLFLELLQEFKEKFRRNE